MPETYLDFVNPVAVSTDPGANQGSVIGGSDCLVADDGDTSYVEVSNGYDQQELQGTDGTLSYRDGGYSKTYRVDLSPDATLPEVIASYDVRYVLTFRQTVSRTNAANVDRVLTTGYQTIGSTTSTTYLEDVPRGDANEGPTWDQIRLGGWSMPFRGRSRFLTVGDDFTYIRITRMRLWVTYTVPDVLAYALSPIRRLQRGDVQAIGGVPRSVQNRSRQATLRRGTTFS